MTTMKLGFSVEITHDSHRVLLSRLSNGGVRFRTVKIKSETNKYAVVFDSEIDYTLGEKIKNKMKGVYPDIPE